VYQAMNSLDDATLQTMFPEMTTDEARAAVGKMHLMGIGTFDADGKFQINTDLLADLFGEGFGLGGGGGGSGGGAETPEERQTAYGDFSAIVKPEIMESMTQSVWEDLGQPTAQEFESWYDSGGQAIMPIMVNPDNFEADFERIWRLTAEHNSTKNPEEQSESSQELATLLSEIAPGQTVEDWSRMGRWMSNEIGSMVPEENIGFGSAGFYLGEPLDDGMISRGLFDGYGYSPDELAQMMTDGKKYEEVVPVNIYNDFIGRGWNEDQVVNMWKFYTMGASKSLWSRDTRAGLEGALVGENAVGSIVGGG